MSTRQGQPDAHRGPESGGHAGPRATAKAPPVSPTWEGAATPVDAQERHGTFRTLRDRRWGRCCPAVAGKGSRGPSRWREVGTGPGLSECLLGSRHTRRGRGDAPDTCSPDVVAQQGLEEPQAGQGQGRTCRGTHGHLICFWDVQGADGSRPRPSRADTGRTPTHVPTQGPDVPVQAGTVPRGRGARGSHRPCMAAQLPFRPRPSLRGFLTALGALGTCPSGWLVSPG